MELLTPNKQLIKISISYEKKDRIPTIYNHNLTNHTS